MTEQHDIDLDSLYPEGADHLEFQRELRKDQNIERTWHLVYTMVPGTTKPAPTADNLPHKVPFEWSTFFPTPAPIEVEIGSGKGGFLVDYANMHPELNILGAEWDGKWGRYAGGRLSRRKMANAAMMRGDFFYFIRDYLPEASVRAFHMYFPDPWPKKAHRNRRLLRHEFLVELRRVVIPGEGALFYWGTDFEEYNQSACETMRETGFMECIDAEAGPTDGIMTNFEKKYRVEGRPIYRSVWRFKHD